MTKPTNITKIQRVKRTTKFQKPLDYDYWGTITRELKLKNSAV